MDFARLLGLAACVMAFAPAALADASAYAGKYRPKGEEFSGWDCESVGMDGGALEITRDGFRGVESYCELRNPVGVNGMNATLFEARCAGEGYEWTERIMFMTAESGVYFVRDGFVAEWLNCAAG